MQPIPLSIGTLDQIRSDVARPSYRHDDLSAGILHVGVGNFHRAHQAAYLDKLFEMGQDRDWAIVGAGVTEFDKAMRERLQSQDWLTTVVELDPDQLSAKVTASMVDFIEVNPRSVISAMANPAIRIVSLTVTEGGYFVDAETGGFQLEHADITADANNKNAPQTVFGIIIAALRQRREVGSPPFTVMSCDNLPANGEMARQAVLGLAKLHDDGMHDWIANNVAFPNSMVDCITPATAAREIGIVKESFGIIDKAPVVCEPFHQWVLEDTFSSGRPSLEKVGVEFVEDVAPYELMKLRILNGGHASIAYLAGLLDIHYVHDAMRNPLVTGFLNKLEGEEIIPTLDEIPGVDFHAYYKKIVERFSNEAVGDTIPRLCFDGANRQPKFILPVVEARLSQDRSIDGLSLECALWCRYCYGSTEGGNDIPANDPQWERLNLLAKKARENPRAWLELTDVYGPLARDKAFETAFVKALSSLWDKGISATVEQYIRQTAQ